tara:strand:- start:33 stop:521 length:489 start_codon:yes stop_codon:yes gene_type:complete
VSSTWLKQCFHFTTTKLRNNDDWRIKGKSISEFNKDNDVWIFMKHIQHLLTSDNLELIDLKDIAWRKKNHHISKRGKYCTCNSCDGRGLKFYNCDLKYPPILVEDLSNPMNLKYVAIDGRHRLEKMEAQDIKKNKCYVLQYEDIEEHFILSKEERDNIGEVE